MEAGVERVLFSDGTAWTRQDLRDIYLSGTDWDDVVIGFSTDDDVGGGLGADLLAGEEGNDLLRGGAGGDLLDGGGGIDTASYEGSYRVVINLGLNYAASGDAAGDSFVGIENVIGSALNDRIVGDGAANALFGGDSFDELSGEAGDDVLTGGAGDDELVGGSGSDLFVFAAGDGDDEIGDFVVGTDHLQLSGIVIDTTSELDGNGDTVLDTLVAFDSGDTVLLAGVTGITDPGVLTA